MVGRCVRRRVTMIWWSARLSCLSPLRSSRWRIVFPDEAGIGAAPASRANAASLTRRPRCDQESTTWAASNGPMPGWLSSCGASLLVSFSISRASSRSSAVSCWTRRATARRASSAPRSSGSWRRSGRVAESRLSSRARLSGRSSLRSGSGVVMSRSRSWRGCPTFCVSGQSVSEVDFE